MYKKSLKTLEYEKIIKMLADHTESSLGYERCLALQPITDMKNIKIHLAMTGEAARLLNMGRPPLYGIVDITNELKRVSIGGSLQPEGLLKIARILKVSADLKDYFKTAVEEDSEDNDYSHIEAIISRLYTNDRIAGEIYNAIESEDSVADDASPTLKKIRRQIRLKDSSIRDRLDSILRSQSNQKYLQDNIYSMRDGRYVVPIKKGSQGQIPGVIIDTSATGSTLFVEPMTVVNLNNEIRELEVEEKREIERILKNLSEMVRERGEEIGSCQELLEITDFVFAKGKFAKAINGTEPVLNDQGIINIKKGRHLLLSEEEVVPVDVRVGKDFKTLVITGPNTGGKTVTLKLVGLLTAMAQAGLFIPADQGSEIGVFDNIYADIGDEQSIEQSLSTFSSHMVNIVDILDKVTDNTLVLFDELGAGTDPTEGSMLAISILEYLRKFDLRTVATTHYNELKVYALSEEGVENASMEFDINTLSPTYKLLIGIPGRSNAFEISSKLGLSPEIIEHAKSMVHSEELKFEDMLEEIDKDREIIKEERRKAKEATDQVVDLERRLKRYREKSEDMRDEILKEAREEAREIIQRAKYQSEKTIEEVEELSRNMSRDSNRKLQNIRQSLRKSEKELDSKLGDQGITLTVEDGAEDVKVGDKVSIPSLGQSGEVLTEPDNQDQVQVQVGIMKMNLPLDSLVKDSTSSSKEVTRRSAERTSKRNIREMSPRIDLRGYNTEDAMVELDKYIDDGYLTGLKHLEVIHGKGTGALRQGLQPYFRKHHHIKSFRLGEFEEGGTGVTILELK